MKFRRKGVIALTAALCVALFASTAMAVEVSTAEELKNAINGTESNITVTADMSGNIMFTITRDINIDLGGCTITRSYDTGSTSATPVFYITSGKLTLSNGTIISNNSGGIAEGARVQPADADSHASIELNDVNVTSDGNALSIYADTSGGDLASKPTFAASATINGSSALYGESVGVFLIGKQATLTLNDGEIKSKAFAISGNGLRSTTTNNGGTAITINGGVVISEEACAIYQPQAGSIMITGGTVTGYDGIQIKSGTLTMTGGLLEGTGAFDNSFTYPEGQGDGSIGTGAALSIISHGAVAETGYAGDISINISGDAELRSANGNAIVEANMNVDGTESKLMSLNISGGTFIGAGDKDAISTTNTTDDNTAISGGTFSSDLNTCEGLRKLTSLPTMTQDENGNYVVVTEPATDLDIDESNLAELIVDGALQLKVGQTLQLKAILTPVESNDRVVWSSSDEAVATVDQNGLVKAVAVGTVSISASITRADFSVEDVVAFAIVPATTSDDVKPQPSGSGGGGCSAGFGALALLAALPLLRMRKK